MLWTQGETQIVRRATGSIGGCEKTELRMLRALKHAVGDQLSPLSDQYTVHINGSKWTPTAIFAIFSLWENPAKSLTATLKKRFAWIEWRTRDPRT